jgi:transposase
VEAAVEKSADPGVALGWSPRQAVLERAVFGLNRCGDSRISEILIQPVGWAEASRRWQSRIRKTRVIDAVKRGEMSRRAAARRYAISESVAVKWLERVERDGSREPVGHGGHRASKLMPHRAFLEAARAEKSDVTLQVLCDRLSAERGVKADTSMMSRFFRRIGVTIKKRPLSHASRIART